MWPEISRTEAVEAAGRVIRPYNEPNDTPPSGIETTMSMTITLPEHIRSWIDRQVAEGRYENTDAVIANAVEQVMDPPYHWEDDPELLAAIAEADRGEGVPWTPVLMDQLARDAIENSRRGHQVSDDIKY